MVIFGWLLKKQVLIWCSSLAGQTQLCSFQPRQHGPDLLLQSVRYVQQHQPSQQQVEQWLCEVWGILQHLALRTVEHIPLLPTSQPPSASFLTPLSSPVVVQGRGGQLSKPQMEALELLGVVVVPSLPPHIRHIELQGYLSFADRHGTTQALSKVGAWVVVISHPSMSPTGHTPSPHIPAHSHS